MTRMAGFWCMPKLVAILCTIGFLDGLSPAATAWKTEPGLGFCIPSAGSPSCGTIKAALATKGMRKTALGHPLVLQHPGLVQRRSLSSLLRMNAATSPTSQDLAFELRMAPLYIGGVGRFMRSPEFLRALIDDLEYELENDLLAQLEVTLQKMRPLEKRLAELRAKFEETENQVFGSQIRPIEIEMMPWLEIKQDQEEAVEAKRSEIASITAVRDQALAEYVASGPVDVEYAGFDDRSFSIEMDRSFGLSKDPSREEVDLCISAEGSTYKLVAKWKTRLPDQPLIVNSHANKDGECRGVVISFASADEGPARLCAVAEWFGETKGDDVQQRQQQLLGYLRKDRLQPTLSEITHVAAFSDAIPLKRRNELWIQVVPPQGAGWYNHASKIATDRVAKNSTYYQLKDCPWALVRPFASEPSVKSAKSTGDTTEDAGPPPQFTWSATSFLDANTVQCSVPIKDRAIAIDKSSTGELAMSHVKTDVMDQEVESDDNEDEDDIDVEPYAVAKVSGWPLTSSVVENARQSLVAALKASGNQPLDIHSFRLLVTSPSKVEMWMRLEESEGDE